MPPPERNLGHALLGVRPAEPMGCPRGAQGRTHPPIDLGTNASDVAGVTCKQPSTQPRSGAGAARVFALWLRG